MINEQSYRYLTGEEMKGFGDESAPIDVTRDERCDMNTGKETNKFISFYIDTGTCVRYVKIGLGTRMTRFIAIIYVLLYKKLFTF